MIDPKQVHATLGRHQLADGLPLVMDLERSHDVWMVDARTGEEHLDLFTCFASWPIGYRHPLMEEPGFVAELTRAAQNNPSNSDVYTSAMAEFVEAFATRVTPAGFPHHFWVAGGGLAVENALKTAFDWKARKLGVDAAEDGKHLSVLHFRQAFHGRTGYTMSLTNTDPNKVALFPKFDWPRVHNPAIRYDLDGKIENDVAAEEQRSVEEIEAAFRQRKDSIAAIIIEPMQGEGGDNHFRPEFLRELRRLADEHEALLIYDEVQTGFFGSGKPWLWQHHGVAPDVVCFGKKTQVCGIYAGTRVDEVADNVFHKPSRINSTWGGNLVDMVRCRRFIEIVEEESLAERVTKSGALVVDGLRELARERGGISNVRGCGSLIAFDAENGAERDALLHRILDQKALALACGPRSIRFRLPLVLKDAHVPTILERVAACLPGRVQA